MTKRINIIYHNFFRTICFCDELFRIFLYLEIEFFLICYSNNTHCKYTDTRTHLGFFYQHLHDHLFHLSISLAIRRFYIIMYIYIYVRSIPSYDSRRYIVIIIIVIIVLSLFYVCFRARSAL